MDKIKQILEDLNKGFLRLGTIFKSYRSLPTDVDKGILWLGPICVLAFVLILTVMYGWVGNIKSTGGEGPETPDLNLVNQVQVGRQGQGGQLVHHGKFPAGIGNGQIQLINNPTFPTGIGNGQIKLIGLNQLGPYLGLSLGDIPDFVARDLKIKADTGVYVKKVIPASPAEKAGLKGGDILFKCDHKQVNSKAQVGKILTTKKTGDVIKLVVNRNGRKMSLHVKLEEMPDNLMTVAATSTGPTWMGADIQNVDAVMKLQFSLPDNRGVIVSYVAGKSPAQTAGIKVGDVIRRFGETRIRDVKQLQSLILKGNPGKQVQLAILRDSQYLTIPITLGQKAPGTTKIPFVVPAEIAIEGTWIGMDVAELSAGDASALGLPAGTRGILVEDVESPPATMVGFQTGDVITAINGTPTPEMKQFVKVTRNLSGAVVDVIRGNKHLFLSVPPPGFTQQGTKLKGTFDNKFKQVATAIPSRGMLAIFAAGPELSSAVAGNITSTPYLILVDLANNRFAAIGPNSTRALVTTVSQYGITGLVCRNISPQSASMLAAGGVNIYSGVVGNANEAIGLYESGRLVAMRN